MKQFQRLKNLLEERKIGVFVGAGVSQASGLPNWENLLLELLENAESHHGANSDWVKELKHLIKDPANYLLVAEELKDFLQIDFYTFIRKRFYDSSLKPSKLLEKIIEIDYKYIITTNYDVLIETALGTKGLSANDFTYKDAGSVNYNYLIGEKFVLKAHGDARRAPSEIIITEKDYRNILFNERGYKSVINSLFSTSHIVFFGASLKDPELKLLLGFVQDIFHSGSPEHYAFMPKEELSDAEINRWRKDFRINIIPYSNKDSHEELYSLVCDLVSK